MHPEGGANRKVVLADREGQQIVDSLARGQRALPRRLDREHPRRGPEVATQGEGRACGGEVRGDNPAQQIQPIPARLHELLRHHLQLGPQ